MGLFGCRNGWISGLCDVCLAYRTLGKERVHRTTRKRINRYSQVFFSV